MILREKSPHFSHEFLARRSDSLRCISCVKDLGSRWLNSSTCVYLQRFCCRFFLLHVEELRKLWVFPKIGVPQIIHFNRVFHYKPSILGYQHFLGNPPVGVFSGRFFCQVPMAHRRARDLLAAMTAFAGTDNFVEARFHL